MRFAVGVLFVVLACGACAPAMAQGAEQFSQASVLQAMSPEPRAFRFAEIAEGVGRISTDDGSKQALVTDAPAGDASTAGFNQEPLTPGSILDPPNDCLEECCPQFCCNPCPCFYAQVEALFFVRSPRFRRQPIVVDANTGETFMSTSDLTNIFNPGIRATFGMRLCGGRALEFDYFGLFPGSASAVALRADAFSFLIFPDNFFANVFVDMDRVAANYSSGLQSIAMNFPCCCGCSDPCDDECGNAGGCGEVYCQSIEWFAGFRYMNLGERLDIEAQRTVGGGLEEGSYNIRTANNLYGGQLGARVRRTRGRWGYEATGTAGLFANTARQTQSVTDFPNFPLRPTVSSSSTGLAFVGWANLSAIYRLTNVWNLRAGYNLLWIEGLALAPDQLDFNFATSPSGNQLNNNGGLLLHGVNVGLEARW